MSRARTAAKRGKAIRRAATPAAVLVATGVRKEYHSGSGPVVALGGVDLSIRRGEFVAVVGPSGSGKSTLLNCLAGLDTVTAGSVTVDGRQLERLSDARRARLRAEQFGFVFQHFNLVPVLSAVENVELPLIFAGRPPREARQRAEVQLARTGLAHRRDHRPHELSGGEQQRVAVARALVADPTLIWADEPTGSLDSSAAATVLALLAELHSDGATLVVVTHDDAVAAMAARRLVMRDGMIVADELAGAQVAGA